MYSQPTFPFGSNAKAVVSKPENKAQDISERYLLEDDVGIEILLENLFIFTSINTN
jgi:hypothetical protein